MFVMDLEHFRFAAALTGSLACALLFWRLIGRWLIMDWIGRLVVSLLAVSVLTSGLGAARAAAIRAPFNEFLLAAFAIQVCSILVCVFWRRLLDPHREVRRL